MSCHYLCPPPPLPISNMLDTGPSLKLIYIGRPMNSWSGDRIPTPDRSGGRISSQELSFRADSYLVPVPHLCYHSGTQETLVILQKVQMAGYIKTFTHHWPKQVRVGWLSCPGTVQEPIWGNRLTRNLSGNARPLASQIAEPLWTDPGLRSGMMSWYALQKKKKKQKQKKQQQQTNKNKKNKKRRWGMIRRTSSKNPCMRGAGQQQQIFLYSSKFHWHTYLFTYFQRRHKERLRNFPTKQW